MSETYKEIFKFRIFGFTVVILRWIETDKIIVAR